MVAKTKEKLGNISTKEIIFYGIYLLLLLLECWPGLFMGNSATPFILGLPFFIMYQYAAVFITTGIFIAQYIKDDKDGELDLDVDPTYNYLKDINEFANDL